MPTIDLTQILAPVIASLVVAVAGLLTAVLTGLTASLKAWLSAHGQAAVGDLVASAGAEADRLVNIGAGTIAGKIQAGTLNYADPAAIRAEAEREAALVLQRMPGELLAVAPTVATLTASMVAKVGAQVLASPTLPSAPLEPALALAGK